MSRAASVLPFCNISGRWLQDRPSLRACRLAQARQVDDRPTWCVLLIEKNLPPREQEFWPAGTHPGKQTPGQVHTWQCSLCIRARPAASRQPQIPTRTPALFRTSTESQQTASTPNGSNTNSFENINTNQNHQSHHRHHAFPHLHRPRPRRHHGHGRRPPSSPDLQQTGRSPVVRHRGQLHRLRPPARQAAVLQLLRGDCRRYFLGCTFYFFPPWFALVLPRWLFQVAI